MLDLQWQLVSQIIPTPSPNNIIPHPALIRQHMYFNCISSIYVKDSLSIILYPNEQLVY